MTSPHAYALAPTLQDVSFDVTPGYGDTVSSFFATGVDHLLTGIDHMLFVTMLLVPAMFRRNASEFGPGAKLQPVTDFRAMFIESLKVLSAFTLAHGTTLTLSVLHLVYIPERVSEAGIALTILATALDNIFHFIPGRRWPLAFAFGLVHGLGFATALGPMTLPPIALGIALISFNLGLEAAQVTIAAIVLPIGFLLRNTVVYPRRILPGVSGAVALVALAWFTDRAVGMGTDAVLVGVERWRAVALRSRPLVDYGGPPKRMTVGLEEPYGLPSFLPVNLNDGRYDKALNQSYASGRAISKVFPNNVDPGQSGQPCPGRARAGGAARCQRTAGAAN